MNNEEKVTSDEIREFYGILDEGDIVDADDLEDKEVLICPMPTNE